MSLFKGMVNFVLHGSYGKKMFYSFYNSLYNLSLSGMNIGLGSNPIYSGESFVLDYLCKSRQGKNGKKVIIFDCGANKGQYAVNAYERIRRTSNIGGG